ncbi:hypothetical protein [Candidatus Endomicrobiellum agilis]|uniref:hypothetical protein n=1 Tax=Candidatus Endomicrobiellum agilis TaxID=3238957 RepID=UPI0035815EB7|nr:hypothetical protein [Endomicrobium sp.]
MLLSSSCSTIPVYEDENFSYGASAGAGAGAGRLDKYQRAYYLKSIEYMNFRIALYIVGFVFFFIAAILVKH